MYQDGPSSAAAVPKLHVWSYRTLVFPELYQGAPPLTLNNSDYFLILHKKKIKLKDRIFSLYIVSQSQIKAVHPTGSTSHYIFY